MPELTAPAILKIFQACSQPLHAVLENLPDHQLHWKPAPDARSIGEIFRHLVRVDGHVLRQFGLQPAAPDPGEEADAHAILQAVKAMHGQVAALLENMESDARLLDAPTSTLAAGHDTLGEWLVHLAQHCLYHLAQTAYLRRAQDRTWEAPQKGWESATYVLSDGLACMAGIVQAKKENG